MIFNAAELDPPAGLFEKGSPPERRTIKIKPAKPSTSPSSATC